MQPALGWPVLVHRRAFGVVVGLHTEQRACSLVSMNSRRHYTVPLPDGFSLELGERTLVMGIVNVTPDSFSDGGLWLDPGQAVDHALAMVAAGADLLDRARPSWPPTKRWRGCCRECGIYADRCRFRCRSTLTR